MRNERLERGSVESGLVLIPTTICFLLILQIVIAGSFQITERSKLHDFVIRSALDGSDGLGDTEEFALSRTGTYGSKLSESKFENQDVARRYLKIDSTDTELGKIERLELTSSIPIIGDLFWGLSRGIFEVKNRAIRILD